MCHPCVPFPLLLRPTQVFNMPSHADIAANEAAESWGRAVRDRCGERHVCGPTFSIESYGSLWKLLDAGTDAEVLHATIRALPLTADQPGVLSDHVIALFHQAPNLKGLVLNLPVASSDTLLEALEAFDRPKPGARKVHRLREVEGQLMFARKATGASGYGQLACNIAPITCPHFDDTAPVRSLHSAERLVWASDIHGMTTPERYTSVGGEVPLTFPAVAEPMIGTDDGRVVAPVFRGVNHDLADLVAEQHTLVDEILSPEEVTALGDLCNAAPHRAKYKPIFQVAPWEKRIPDSRERTAWYPAGKDAAPAAGIILRIAQQVEDACGTKLPHRSWGFVRVTKYTAAGTLTPRQSWHRDVDRAFYPDDAAAFSCLIPVTHHIVPDGMEGQFVAYSAAGLPDPWQPIGMTADLGQGWVFNSRTVHRGGSVPRAESDDRVMLFLALSQKPYDYQVSCPITPPFWAPLDDVPAPLPVPDEEGNEPDVDQPALDPLNPAHDSRFDAPAGAASSSSSSAPTPAAAPQACGRCTRDLGPGAMRCLSQSCRRSLCARCSGDDAYYCRKCDWLMSAAHPTLEDAPAAATAAAPAAPAAAAPTVGLQPAMIAFATTSNTHLALWVTAAEDLGEPRDASSAPQYHNCPMQAYHWHPFPGTTAIKDDAGLCLLYVRPSSVAVARNVVGGVAWTEGPPETRGPPCVWRWLMMPRGIRPTDPSVLVKGGWCSFWNGSSRAESGATDTELWCACEQVCTWLLLLVSLPYATKVGGG